MNGVQKYGTKLPTLKSLELAKQYFIGGLDSDIIELRVVIPSEDVNVKELCSFFSLVYRIDGTLSTEGIRSYSHNRIEQIKFSELKFGSAEFNFQEILASAHAERLLLIWMFLKYIPVVVNAFLSAGEQMLGVQLKYEELVEKREKRRVRKALRELLADDLAEIQINKRTKEKLVIILGELYSQNIKDLPAASRFIRNYVKTLNISVKAKRDKNQ
jgi:hypothetical protein